ncbi:MAG TPA: hypothetical protein VF816_09850 [Rhodocyclaceae bacterium]
MTAFLFLQRFESGMPAALPFEPVMELLSRYGKVGRGRGDLEVCFDPGEIAAGCTVVGSAEAGVGCIGFERPRFDKALRRIVWDCVERFGCAVFDDSLDTVYAPLDGIASLPAELAAASANGVRQLGGAQQLWPDGLEQEEEGRPVPGMRYTNPNASGPNLQFFDYGEQDNQILGIELALRPEACNADTLRVLRNLELRVDAAWRANSGHGICFRYASPEASLQVLESPRLGETACRFNYVTPPPWMEERPVPFIADRSLYFAALAQCRELADHVRGKYGIELDGSPESIDRLAAILDKLHLYYRQERGAHTGAEPFASPLAINWAIKAGAYLGDLIRREIGGQWGHATRGRFRLPAVRTHAGRNRHPHLQVLDHIVNGPRDSVAEWYRQIAASDASACPRDQDLARDIPLLAHLLLGQHRFAAGGLPLAESIPRDWLDFSVGSLRRLDDYLAQVAGRSRSAGIPQQDYSNLVLAAGAYFGEVVRGNAPAKSGWQWTTYDDYARRDAEFSARRPREGGYLAFLDGEQNTFYPLQQIASLAIGQEVASTYDQAVAVGCPPAPPPRPEADILRPAAIDAWPVDYAMATMLRQTQDQLTTWRRMATSRDIQGLRAMDPGWMGKGPLAEVFAGQALLLEKGLVVWGALVQANNGLFQAGEDDLPAALLYSTDPHFEARPQALRRIARELFAYKGGGAPAPLKRIADMLADEYEVAFDVPVPDLVTDRPAAISAFLAYRRHLPGGVLTGAWFPVLTHPDTRARMIAPRQFWPDELVALWRSRKLMEG